MTTSYCLTRTWSDAFSSLFSLQNPFRIHNYFTVFTSRISGTLPFRTSSIQQMFFPCRPAWVLKIILRYEEVDIRFLTFLSTLSVCVCVCMYVHLVFATLSMCTHATVCVLYISTHHSHSNQIENWNRESKPVQ